MEKEKTQKNNRLLYILIGIIILLLVGLGVYFLLNKDKKEEPKLEEVASEFLRCGIIQIDEENNNALVRNYVLEFRRDELSRIDRIDTNEILDESKQSINYEGLYNKCLANKELYKEKTAFTFDCSIFSQAKDNVKSRVVTAESFDFIINAKADLKETDLGFEFKINDKKEVVQNELAKKQFQCE